MARRQPGRGVERHRPARGLSRRRAARQVADADSRRVRRAGRGRRPRLRPRLPGDAGQPHDGRPRTAARARRGDRRGPLDAGVAGDLPQHPLQVRDRSAGDPHGGRRPGPRPGSGRDAVVLRRRDGRPALAGRHRRRLRRDGARLRRFAVAAGRGRPPHRPARRRAGRDGGGVRQADRRRGVARHRDHLGAGLLLADRDHRRRGAAVDRLARRGGDVARSGHRRHLVAARLSDPERADHRHAGPQRALPAGDAGGERRPDAGPQLRPPRGAPALGRREPEPDRPSAAGGDPVDAGGGGRRPVRPQQLRRVPRRRRGDRRTALVDRPAHAARAVGELVPGP